MSPNEKERIISGEMEMPEVDSELRELVEDARALEVLLGDDQQKRDDAVVAAVLEEVGHSEPARSSSPELPWLRAAAILVGGLGAGIATGWILPKSEADSGASTASLVVPPNQDTASPVSEQPADGSQGALFAAVAELDADGMRAAYVALGNQFRGPNLAEARRLLVARWAELDPAGAVAFLLESDEREDLVHLFAAWARLDPELAWGASQELSGRLRDESGDAVLAWLAKSDPEGFLKIAAAASHSNPSDWRTAFRLIGEAGTGQSELEAMLGDLQGENRKGALQGIGDWWAEQNPEGALAWADALESKTEQDVALVAVLETIGKSDPEAAGTALREMPGRFPDVEKQIAMEMAVGDPFDAIRWVQSYSSDLTRPSLYRDVAVSMLKNDDNRLYDLLDGLRDDEGVAVFRKDERLDDIFWMGRGLDFEKGIDWVGTLPDETYGKRYMIPSMIFSWAKEDMDATVAYIDRVEDPVLRAQMNSAVVAEMVSTSSDLEAAWEFATNLPESGKKEGDVLRVFGRYAKQDPEAAAGRLEQLPSESARQSGVGEIAKYWGRYAPSEAVAWAGELSEADSQTVAYAEIAKNWSAYDSYGASEWIGALEAGTGRDAAVEQLVANVAPYEGDSAFAWALTVSDGDVRQRSAAIAVKEWGAQDPVAARATISGANLPAAEKTELLSVLEVAQQQKGGEQ